MKKRVLVAMSGGIDSSVTAALLKTQGYDVIGLHLQMWDETDKNIKLSGGRCCNPISVKDVQKICHKLEIPYHSVNAKDQFEGEVIDYTVHEFLAGRKPNPCVVCNSHLKFDYLLAKANDLKCEFIATGHYAKIITNQGDSSASLYKPVDRDQDQTYFLFGLKQQILSRTIMPLGDLLRQNVLKLAGTFELPAEHNTEKTEICMIGNRGYKTLVESRTTERFRHPGHIIDQQGRPLGRHDGLYLYSIGQCTDLNIILPDATNVSENHGYCVVGFDTKLNALIVGKQEELYKSGLIAKKCNWIGPIDFSKTLHVTAKISHTDQEAQCRLNLMNNDSVVVYFNEPQYAITPGQPVVFYQGEQVIGGGWIEDLTQPITTIARNLKDLHG